MHFSNQRATVYPLKNVENKINLTNADNPMFSKTIKKNYGWLPRIKIKSTPTQERKSLTKEKSTKRELSGMSQKEPYSSHFQGHTLQR